MSMTFYKNTAAVVLITVLSGCAQDGTPFFAAQKTSNVTSAHNDQASLPSLVTTSQPAPEVIYHRGARDTVLAGEKVPDTRIEAEQNIETPVTRRAADLGNELAAVRKSVSSFDERLRLLQSANDNGAASYYELVAGLNTELQAGSTPGNPLLVSRWNQAQSRLENLSQGAALLNDLATDLSEQAAKASFLQDNVRAAYSLSGAVKADHVKLRGIEDGVNVEIAALGRLLTSVNDEINRRSSYLRSERLNLQTLSLAIENGELYGRSLTNSLYKKAAEDGQALAGTAITQRRPLVVIRFDRANVNYEQALYNAVEQTLEKFPSAKFNLVAVSPTAGNPAQKALATTAARKNGEAVLRSLAQMGLPMERVEMNTTDSSDAKNSEVHLYIR